MHRSFKVLVGLATARVGAELSDSMKKMSLPTPPNLVEVLQINQRCLE